MCGYSLFLGTLLLGSASAFIDDLFRMHGGGGGRMQMPEEFKWPKGIPKKINKAFSWLQGTEWKWNDWRNVRFDYDGTFFAPTPECEQNDMCKWSASKDLIYIVWGKAGVHTLKANEMKAEAGTVLSGKRKKDGDPCKATFVKIDEEQAELNKDLFAVLGLTVEASDAQIKKAYRKLSVQYHPDKNGDDPEALKRFNEVRSAYEVLSDEDKRFLYETAGLKAVREAEKEDASQAHHHGGLSAFFGGGQQKKTKAKKGPDYSMNVKVSLDDLYNGNTISHNIKRRVVCKRCADSDEERCRKCNPCPGGVKLVQKQMGNMIVQQQVDVPSKEKCTDESAELESILEKGMADGTQIVHKRMSEQKPGEIPGDVILTLKTKKHALFTRDGNDLRSTHTITLRDALVGFTSSIKHMDGREVEFSRSGITDPNHVHKIKGEGMPLHDDPASKGDLYVTLKIQFPKKISDETKETIKTLFPN